MDTLSRLRSGKLHGVTRLDLSCGLTTFPAEIFDLADTLEVLNLSGNALTSLPDELPRLHKLKVIFCSDNPFTVMPEVLGRCENLEMVGFKANRISCLPAASLPPKLRWLILTDNRLESLPDELGRCIHLQKLMLAGNRLRQLPESLAACRNLELLRISANQLAALPEWLFDLSKLAWLAFAGNPFSAVREADALARQAIPHIAWHGLDVQHVLGEGASGVIHKADWHHAPGGSASVAVKLFKGAVTSDGWPKSEKAASLAAGTHPNLIAAAGKIGGHPEGRAGLVMPLVDASFRTLAGPPSLASCTRDVYPPDTRFMLEVAIQMATGIARAAEYLHDRGIQHGDLYAHNLLWNGQGNCLLGDFGAASFISDERHADALQRIEVRAFSCLLEELLERCEPMPQAVETRETLWELQRRCAQADVGARPLFVEVRERLEGVQG
ncbi:MAG: leucine-rich repeat-containing protein kinase family protein [Gallionella sp.]|nr:leucine-rich repeat-containing protein kinase family protein [Gallionella sp.]MDD4947742.1 leucine-rich repeat-containing protein kinase family protein [Gallionella sp.]MDD5613159.1 leucine-rich repeat-containing protein kinase family protein [Gallionella sp.]